MASWRRSASSSVQAPPESFFFLAKGDLLFVARDEEVTGDDDEDGRFPIPPARAYLPDRDFLDDEDTGDFPPSRGDTEDEAYASGCLALLRRCLGIVDCWCNAGL